MIYLDSAATTLQKPPSVTQAVMDAMLRMSSPGRGGYASARLADQTVFACRQTAAHFFEVASPEQVVFTMNATHALNIAIKSVVPQGGKVVISGYEHNAVTRPLYGMKDVTVKVAEAPLFDTQGILQAFAREIEAGVDAVICTHVSNVFGFVLPIAELAELCARKKVPLVVDASQSAGILPVSLKRWQAAYIALPGHKSLYGPQGTGLLLCGENRLPQPLLAGGTGSASKEQQMPDFLPDRLEAGTLSVAGIAGLLAGLRFVQERGIETIAQQERRLTEQAAEGLSRLPQVEIFWPYGGSDSVLSFRLSQLGGEETAEQLAEQGFALRGGFHCAPLAHQTAGTLQTGTVRLSTSVFNRPEQIRRFVQTVGKITPRR